MEAKELMLENWVYVPHNGSASHYGRVNAIHESTNSISVKLEDGNCLCDVRSLLPIPITPKILEKNFEEFIPGINLMYELGGPYVISNEIDQWVFTLAKKYESARYPLVKIYYVHQLQNALRLCGIDKEIKL